MVLDFGKKNLFGTSFFKPSAEDGQSLIFAGDRQIPGEIITPPAGFIDEKFKDLSNWETGVSSGTASYNVTSDGLYLQTGATNTSKIVLISKNYLGTITQKGNMTFEAKVKFIRNSSAGIIGSFLGLLGNYYPATPTSNNVTALGQDPLEDDPGNIDWNAVCIDEGIGNILAYDGDWHTIKIKIVKATGIYYYIDDVLEATITGARLTTFSEENLRLIISLKTSEAANQQLYIEYITFKYGV